MTSLKHAGRSRWLWSLAAFNALCAIYLIVMVPNLPAWVVVAYAFAIGSVISDTSFFTAEKS